MAKIIYIELSLEERKKIVRSRKPETLDSGETDHTRPHGTPCVAPCVWGDSSKKVI